MSKEKSNSLFREFQKMRLPNLGATRRFGEQASLRIKFDLPIMFGGGSYYILESDHQNTVFAIYVSEWNEISGAKLIKFEESEDIPDKAIWLDGGLACIDRDYKPETRQTLRIRINNLRLNNDIENASSAPTPERRKPLI